MLTVRGGLLLRTGVAFSFSLVSDQPETPQKLESPVATRPSGCTVRGEAVCCSAAAWVGALTIHYRNIIPNPEPATPKPRYLGVLHEAFRDVCVGGLAGAILRLQIPSRFGFVWYWGSELSTMAGRSKLGLGDVGKTLSLKRQNFKNAEGRIQKPRP